jgi:hypothetical protein
MVVVRELVTACLEDLGQHAVFVPQTTMGVLDDDLDFVHGRSSLAEHGGFNVEPVARNRCTGSTRRSQSWCPEAGPMSEHGREQIRI